MFDLEAQISTWRTHFSTAKSITNDDLEELESHLRDSIDALVAQQLTVEEAFLIGIRRLGDIELITEEFSKTSTEDMWKQLFIPAQDRTNSHHDRKELLLVIGLAILAGLLGKIPALFGFGDIDAYGSIYLRNASLFAFIPVALYLLYKNSLPMGKSLSALGMFILLTMVINGYPSFEPHHTQTLSAIHLPIITLSILLFFFGGSSNHGGKGWKHVDTRLNFIRFIGECFIFSVLIGLGGITLILLTMGTFELVGLDASAFVQFWMAPLGFFGLFPVAAYLVEQKKSLIESMAPVLSRIFTPLFLIVLLALIVAFTTTPHMAYENRSLLIWFDVILALVLALTLYSMSAKDQTDREIFTIWDAFTLALLVSAMVIDVIALAGIVIRLSTYGFSPNKSAALGENLILLVNLSLLGIGYLKFLFKRKTFRNIVELQMKFLPIYAVWAVVVVLFFPLIFAFT